MVSDFVSTSRQRFLDRPTEHKCGGQRGRACSHWPVCSLATVNRSAAQYDSSWGETRPGLYKDYRKTHYDDYGNPYYDNGASPSRHVPEWVTRTLQPSLGMHDVPDEDDVVEIEARLRELRGQMKSIEGELIYKPLGQRVIPTKPQSYYECDDFENYAPESHQQYSRQHSGHPSKPDARSLEYERLSRKVNEATEGIDDAVAQANFALSVTGGKKVRPRSATATHYKNWKDRPLTSPKGFSFSDSKVKEMSITQRKAALDEEMRKMHEADMVRNIVKAKKVPKTNDPGYQAKLEEKAREEQRQRVEKRKEELKKKQKPFAFSTRDEIAALAKSAWRKGKEKEIYKTENFTARSVPKSTSLPIYSATAEEKKGKQKT